MRRAQDIIRDWSGQVRLGQGGQGQLQKHHKKHVLTAINLFLYAQVCFQQKWRQLNTCTKSTYHKCTQTECATWNIHDTGNTDTERQVSASNEQVEFSSPPRCQEKHDTSRSMGRELSGTSVKSGGWVNCSSELEGNYSLFLSLKFLTHEHPSNFKYHTWEESVKLEATSNLFFLRPAPNVERKGHWTCEKTSSAGCCLPTLITSARSWQAPKRIAPLLTHARIFICDGDGKSMQVSKQRAKMLDMAQGSWYVEGAWWQVGVSDSVSTVRCLRAQNPKEATACRQMKFTPTERPRLTCDIWKPYASWIGIVIARDVPNDRVQLDSREAVRLVWQSFQSAVVVQAI